MIRSQSEFLKLLRKNPEAAFQNLGAESLNPETLVKAIEISPFSLMYLRNLGLTDEFLDELRVLAVSLNNEVISIIPEERQTPEMVSKIRLDDPRGIDLIFRNVNKSLLTQEMFDAMLSNSKYPTMEGYPKHLMTQQNIIRVVRNFAPAFPYIPDEYISEEVAQAIFLCNPGIFPSLPDQFKTLEFAIKYTETPAQLSRLKNGYAEHIAGMWLEDPESVALKFEAPLPTDPVSALKALREADETYTNENWFYQTGVKIILTKVLASFSPKIAWSAAMCNDEKSLVEKAFGRDRLVREVDLDAKTKNKWISDSLEI